MRYDSIYSVYSVLGFIFDSNVKKNVYLNYKICNGQAQWMLVLFTGTVDVAVVFISEHSFSHCSTPTTAS